MTILPKISGDSPKRFTICLNNHWDVKGWREQARHLLVNGIKPEQVIWQVASDDAPLGLDLFDDSPVLLPVITNISQPPKISKDLLKLINTALLHNAADRFHLAYNLIFRSLSQRNIHRNPADPDAKRLHDYARSVRRDIHKMHAFVRFRKTGETDDGREQFIAWFEPDHHITQSVAPFFRNRFNGMDWIIITPEASIGWDGEKLSYGPGGQKSDVPAEDRMEQEWRAYYSHIFNPARVKVAAMKSEMPVKYWKNLPEAELIAPLIRDARGRVEAMAVPDNAQIADIEPQSASLAQAPENLAALYANLLQTDIAPSDDFSDKIILGEGPEHAQIMLIGEQPGDEEDKQKRVFVGPAGQMLNRAMSAAGLNREELYLTNAVKRFKYTRRGPRRIHRTPTAGDIKHYQNWLQQEIALVQPDLIVALGATAARALTGKQTTISRNRSTILAFQENTELLITVHPSYLLRLPDEEGRRIEYEKFVRDLKIATAYAENYKNG